jgi:hypothetical protein
LFVHSRSVYVRLFQVTSGYIRLSYDVNLGQVRSGYVWLGQVKSCYIRLCLVRLGYARLYQVMSG